MKAVIYARYSSHNQREESIEGQLRECYEFAKRNDIIVIDEYCDRAISGRTDKRPMFQKMIKDSDKGKFDAIIMYTLDRFARDRYDSALYKARLKKNGVKLFYAKQPLPDSPESIILESVLEGFAEYYSANLSRGVKRGMHENALKGMSNGSRLLGYDTVDKKYVVNPVEAKAVKYIFEMYASGTPLSKITDDLNSKGFKTKKGKPFNRNSFHSILNNEKYTGIYSFGDVKIPSAMPAIITKELFDKAQERIKMNKVRRGRNKASVEYLLTGKLFCGHCGASMIGDSGTSKSGKVHNYYTCLNRKTKSACDKKSEKKQFIEDAVINYTVQKMLTKENIELIAEKAYQLYLEELSDNSLLNSLKESLEEVTNRIDNLINAAEQGIYSPTTKGRLLVLEEEKETLELQIEKEEAKKPIITKEVIIFWFEQFITQNVNDLEYRRRIVDTLVNSVFVYDDGGAPDKLKIRIMYNLFGENEVSLKCSDFALYAPPQTKNPNKLLIFIYLFGFFLFHSLLFNLH